MGLPGEQSFFEGETHSGTLNLIQGDQTEPGDVPAGVTYGMLVVKPPFTPTDALLYDVSTSTLCEPQPEVGHYATTANATAIRMTVGTPTLESTDPSLATHEQRSQVAAHMAAYLIDKLNEIETGNVTL